MDEKLARAINSKQMVALVGAGASVDAGLPDWKKLCDEIAKLVLADKPDQASEYARLLEKRDYGELMEKMSRDIGIM